MGIKLIIPALCNALLSVVLYLIQRKTAIWNIPNKAKQIIYGILFGLIAMYSSTPLGGIDIGGAVINVRDAAPICAGLIFGAPAGIIAGLIGGIFRYFAADWGLAGTYTRLACRWF